VVGEGVETDAALATLRSIGCDAAQGFLLASPMPAEQLRKWLEPAVNSRPVAGSVV
jgi:EAL domain-containing protein (putative c-di-GMP-specific phosphodiesterase class I)